MLTGEHLACSITARCTVPKQFASPPAHALTLRPAPSHPAGYQGAYGIVVEVDSHPFDLGTMLFMDWRDDHLDADPEVKRRNAA